MYKTAGRCRGRVGAIADPVVGRRSPARPPKLIYVAGYSRSGSTLLDVVLSAHPDAVGIGEVTYLLDDWSNPLRLCTCGEPYGACDFWGNLFGPAGPSDEVRRALRQTEARRSLPRLLSGRLPEPTTSEYRQLHRRLFAHVRTRSGCAVVVDSSKSARDAAGRCYALRELVGEDVYVLHLVRSGLGVLHSYHTVGSNWVAEGYGEEHRWRVLRAAVGWVLANSTALLLGRLFPGRYLRIRYEDFIRDPASVLRQIGRFVGLDLKGVGEHILREGALRAEHNVGGNRMRHKKRIVVRRKAHTLIREGLPLGYRLAFYMIGGVLQRYFGYGRAAATSAMVESPQPRTPSP